jgi:ABC-2 type transport system permease protein
MVSILGYLTSGNYKGGGVTSYDYYGVSLIIFTVLYVAMTAANSFMEERVKSSNLRIMYSPINPSSIYMSKIAATFVFSSVCVLVSMAILKLCFNVNYGGENIVYVIILLELLNLLSATIGILFCCIFKSEQLANKTISPFINIFAILGGVFFPIDSLGKTVEKLSYISPAKWVDEGIFKIIYDKDLSYFGPTVIILIAFTIIFIIGCKLTFKVEDYV